MTDTDILLSMGDAARCIDGRIGSLRGFVINPIFMKLSNIIIHYRYMEYHIPAENIARSTSDSVMLSLKCEELRSLPAISTNDAFLFSHYFNREYNLDPDAYSEYEETVGKSVPIHAGEMPIKHDNQIFCTDGKIGSLKRILIEPDTKEVKYIYVRRNFLRQNAAIKISAKNIDDIYYNCILLKIDTKTSRAAAIGNPYWTQNIEP